MQKAGWLNLPEIHKRNVEDIVERITQPVIFLLGAGASAAAGLPTMTSFLKDEYGEDFITSLDKPTNYKLNTQNVNDVERNQPELLKMLFQLCSLERDSVCYDLEVVFELIHQIQGYISGNAEATKKLICLFQICAKHPNRNFSDFKNIYNNENQKLSGWLDDMKKVLATLREKMYDRYLVGDVSPQIIDVWKNYQSLFSKCKVDKPVIFTTNYDTLFEAIHDQGQMDYDLLNGVKPTRRRRVFELRNYLKENSENPLYLFKMHGSVTWDRKDRNIFDYYPIRQPTSPAATPTVQKPLGIIEPVLSKSETVPPFSYMYAIFENTLRKAEICVCIGLSFRDTNIYELVGDTLKKQTGLKLICVSPDHKTNETQQILNVNENLSKLEEQHRNVLWLKQYFETPVIDNIAKKINTHRRNE